MTHMRVSGWRRGERVIATAVLVVSAACRTQSSPETGSGSTPSAGPSSCSAPLPRGGAGLAYDPEIKQDVLFGGVGGVGRKATDEELANLSATWLFDGQRWRPTHPPGAPYPPPALLALTYDPDVRGILMVGNLETTTGDKPLGLWVYRNSRWTALRPAHPPVLSESPYLTYATKQRVAVLTGALSQKVWLFDGRDWRPGPPRPAGSVSGLADDPSLGGVVALILSVSGIEMQTWKFDGTGWKQIATGGLADLLRFQDYAIAYDGRAKALTAIGSNVTDTTKPNAEFTQVWRLTGAGWTPLATSSGPSPPLGGTVIAFDVITFDAKLGRLVLLGGSWVNLAEREPATLVDSTWTLENQTWFKVELASCLWSGSTPSTRPSSCSAPLPRSGAGLAYDPEIKQDVLFGADGVTTLGRKATEAELANLSATWLFDGQRWRPTHPPGAPWPPPTLFALTYDPNVRGVLMVGTSPRDETATSWVYRNSRWTELRPAHSPLDDFFELTYATKQRVAVLIGGSSQKVWLFDGRDWRPGPPRPAGLVVGLADDPSLGGVVALITRGTEIQTWKFDGTSWKQIATGGLPHPRPIQKYAMAYDGRAKALTAIGRNVTDTSNPKAELAQVWRFTGGRWTPLATSTGPSRRAGAEVTFDAKLGRLVLFGGPWYVPEGVVTLVDTTWTLEEKTWFKMELAGCHL